MIFFHETKVWGKGLLKVLFFVKKNDQILNFKKKKILNFFQKIYCPPSLTLEKISIFHQSLRWMFWMIIVDLISVLPHAGYQNVSPGLGEPIFGNKSTNRPFPAKLNLLVFYSIFIDFELRESKISRYCQFGRPIGRFGQAQTNLQTFLSLKTFKISHNSY